MTTVESKSMCTSYDNDLINKLHIHTKLIKPICRLITKYLYDVFTSKDELKQAVVIWCGDNKKEKRMYNINMGIFHIGM